MFVVFSIRFVVFTGNASTRINILLARTTGPRLFDKACRWGHGRPKAQGRLCMSRMWCPVANQRQSCDGERRNGKRAPTKEIGRASAEMWWLIRSTQMTWFSRWMLVLFIKTQISCVRVFYRIFFFSIFSNRCSQKTSHRFYWRRMLRYQDRSIWLILHQVMGGGHVLIVPITHHPTSTIPSEDEDAQVALYSCDGGHNRYSRVDYASDEGSCTI